VDVDTSLRPSDRIAPTGRHARDTMHGVTIRDGTRREMLDSIQSHITRVPSEPVWFLDMVGVAASARGAGLAAP
jgi:hypothetical protein